MMNRNNCPVCHKMKFKEKIVKHGFKIVKCRGCGHIFVLNPQEDTTSQFDRKENIAKFHPRHKQIIRFLDIYFKNDRKIKIAEIGSGVGHFAYLIKDNAQYDYIGYEPSKGRYNFTKQYGLNIQNGFFEESVNTYDAVIMDNVLEHVENPSEIIEIVSSSLIEGGVFIVIVPNINDIRRINPKWRNRHYWQPSCHINNFSFSNLKFLSDKNNMKLYDFGLNTLEKSSSLFLKVKTFLDSIGIHIGGLYTYAIKQ